MNRTYLLRATFALAAALAGCGKKGSAPDNKPAPAGSAVAAAPAGSAAAAGSAAGSAVAAAGSAVDVPTEEDFEAKAATDVTSANVDSKVKAIEDQLGQ